MLRNQRFGNIFLNDNTYILVILIILVIAFIYIHKSKISGFGNNGPIRVVFYSDIVPFGNYSGNYKIYVNNKVKNTYSLIRTKSGGDIFRPYQTTNPVTFNTSDDVVLRKINTTAPFEVEVGRFDYNALQRFNNTSDRYPCGLGISKWNGKPMLRLVY